MLTFFKVGIGALCGLKESPFGWTLKDCITSAGFEYSNA